MITNLDHLSMIPFSALLILHAVPSICTSASTRMELAYLFLA